MSAGFPAAFLGWTRPRRAGNPVASGSQAAPPRVCWVGTQAADCGTRQGTWACRACAHPCAVATTWRGPGAAEGTGLLLLVAARGQQSAPCCWAHGHPLGLGFPNSGGMMSLGQGLGGEAARGWNGPCFPVPSVVSAMAAAPWLTPASRAGRRRNMLSGQSIGDKASLWSWPVWGALGVRLASCAPGGWWGTTGPPEPASSILGGTSWGPAEAPGHIHLGTPRL